MGYINEFAPKMMSEAEVKEAIGTILVQLSLNNREEKLNKGMIMKAVMPELKGKADGKTINKVVENILKQG